MKRMNVSRMVLGVVLLAVVSANATETSTAPLVPDGTVVQATDGTLTRSDSNDLWLFQFARDVNDVGGVLPAGSQLQVLPSLILDSMIADANDRLLPRYRLSALVTRYRGTNYLFPSYYLPLSKLKDANAPQEEPEKLLDTVPDSDVGPGGPLEIPEEVLDRIRTRRQARGPQRREADQAAGAGEVGPDRDGAVGQ